MTLVRPFTAQDGVGRAASAATMLMPIGFDAELLHSKQILFPDYALRSAGEGSASFLKKRSKKLLLMSASVFPERLYQVS